MVREPGCRTDRGRNRSALLGALLCGAHCSLTAAVVALSFALSAAPALFGIPLQYIVPPFFIVGLFAIWLGTGRERLPQVT